MTLELVMGLSCVHVVVLLPVGEMLSRELFVEGEAVVDQEGGFEQATEVGVTLQEIDKGLQSQRPSVPSDLKN